MLKVLYALSTLLRGSGVSLKKYRRSWVNYCTTLETSPKLSQVQHRNFLCVRLGVLYPRDVRMTLSPPLGAKTFSKSEKTCILSLACQDGDSHIRMVYNGTHEAGKKRCFFLKQGRSQIFNLCFYYKG